MVQEETKSQTGKITACVSSAATSSTHAANARHSARQSFSLSAGTALSGAVLSNAQLGANALITSTVGYNRPGMNAAKPILLVTLFFCAGNAFTQQQGKENDEEPVAVVELGGAAAHGLTGEGASFGPQSQLRLRQ